MTNLDLNVIGLSVNSLLIVLIVILLLQCFGHIKCQQQVAAAVEGGDFGKAAYMVADSGRSAREGIQARGTNLLVEGQENRGSILTEGVTNRGSILTEGYYPAAPSPTDYHGGYLNYQSGKAPGNVVTHSRGIDTMEGYRH